jgi:hypothetical protein
VLVNAMIPRPGETAGEWWGNTGQGEAARANDRREGRDPGRPLRRDDHVPARRTADILDWVMGAESGEPVDSLFTEPFGLDRGRTCRRPCWPGRRTGCSRSTSRSGWPRSASMLAAEPLPGGHLVPSASPHAWPSGCSPGLPPRELT